MTQNFTIKYPLEKQFQEFYSVFILYDSISKSKYGLFMRILGHWRCRILSFWFNLHEGRFKENNHELLVKVKINPNSLRYLALTTHSSNASSVFL